MKKTATQMMLEFNLKLTENGQITQINEWSSTHIRLSNGTVLMGNPRTVFIRRVMNKKTDVWVTNIDNIFNGTVLEDDLKFAGRSKGGKAMMRIHGERMKQINLGRVGWNLGMRGKYSFPHTQEAKDKISLANSGSRNGMYGKQHTTETKLALSLHMKELILTGKFTPNNNNRNTHWDAELDNKKYRSSWEALYQYFNPVAEYETLRIKYTIDTIFHVYIVDFVDYINKLVIEVKPKELCVGEKFNKKMEALYAWASKHNFQVLLVDKSWLQAQYPPIDYTRFDIKTENKIKALYATSKKN